MHLPVAVIREQKTRSSARAKSVLRMKRGLNQESRMQSLQVRWGRINDEGAMPAWQDFDAAEG
jgi:hypothetical protein